MRSAIITILLVICCVPMGAQESPSSGYTALLSLFSDWREFQRPPLVDGVPDYSAGTMEQQYALLPSYRERLASIDTTGWPIPDKADYLLIWAEMNGMEFDHRVLRPWERMPGFYAHVWLEQSDVPAHEGPVAHGALEVWQYTFPLEAASERRMISELAKTRAIFERARKNLTGKARDLWFGGIRRMEWHKGDIEGLMTMLPTGSAVFAAAQEALAATDDYLTWLQEQVPSKTAPSGVGVEHYNWYLRHVQLLPYSWADEVNHMKSELARSIASLKLEEHKNTGAPYQPLPATAEEYDKTHHDAVTAFMAFLDNKQIVSVKGYMDAALRAKVGSFSSSGRPENFFAEVDYRDPLTMRAHGYHWIELARMREEPHTSPIRRNPLLYNIFQYRSEGIATGMEEFALHAGLFDGQPRSKELIWMLVAMRASRALSGLYVHANIYDVPTAADHAAADVPRGWFRKRGPLVLGEQDLYLAQPGYGSTYLMGKLQIEDLMAERAQQLGKDFSIKRFMDEFTASGVIPISLIRWEMTRQDDAIGFLAPSEGR